MQQYEKFILTRNNESEFILICPLCGDNNYSFYIEMPPASIGNM